MRTITPCLIPTRSRGCVTISRHHAAQCPYCDERNLAWTSEWEDRKPEGTNKCRHFDGLNPAGAFRFRKGLAVQAGSGPHGQIVTVNGHSIPETLEWLDYALDELASSGVRDCDSSVQHLVPWLRKLFAIDHSYAFGEGLNDRFEAIRAEVRRLRRSPHRQARQTC